MGLYRGHRFDLDSDTEIDSDTNTEVDDTMASNSSTVAEASAGGAAPAAGKDYSPSVSPVGNQRTITSNGADEPDMRAGNGNNATSEVSPVVAAADETGWFGSTKPTVATINKKAQKSRVMGAGRVEVRMTPDGRGYGLYATRPIKEKEKIFDPEEVYKNEPNPTKL